MYFELECCLCVGCSFRTQYLKNCAGFVSAGGGEAFHLFTDRLAKLFDLCRRHTGKCLSIRHDGVKAIRREAETRIRSEAINQIVT